MARRPPPRPASAPPPSPRELLLSTWYGRLFIAAAVVKFVVALWRVTAALPAAARVVSSAATIGLAVALFLFAWRLFTEIKRRLFWRVRRKLILSYIFIGVIPSLLILIFFLFAGSLIFMNVSAYLFKDGYDGIVESARLSAQAAATEIERDRSTAHETVQRVYRIRSQMYPGISVAYLAADGPPVTAGRWTHLPVPQGIPAWLEDDLFAGSLGLPVKDSGGAEDLVVRAFVEGGDGGEDGAVVVDIPLDDDVLHKLHETTGVRLESVFDIRAPAKSTTQARTQPVQSERSLVFEKSLAYVDVNDWETGAVHRDTAG